MTVIGTLKNIPVIPQIEPQIDSANSVAKELMFNVLPISFGSTTLPIKTWIKPTVSKMSKNG